MLGPDSGPASSLSAWCSSVVSQGHVPRLEELEALQNSPDFVAQLIPVLVGHESPDVRLLAAMCLKNLVRVNWRFKLTPEDKALIREAVLRPQLQLMPAATQLAVIAAMIARFDWPERWPDLVPLLMQCLSATTEPLNGQWDRRALMLLHHVVKALMSKTLPKHRQQFRMVSCDLAPFLIDRLVAVLNALAAAGLSGSSPSHSQSEISGAVLLAKCCTNLITHGLAALRTHAGSDAPMELLGACINCLPAIFSKEELDPLSAVLARLLLRSQAHAFHEFAQLLEPAVKMAVGVAFTGGGSSTTEASEDRDRKVVIHCLNLVTQCLLSYTTPGLESGETLQSASRTMDALFNETALETLVWALLRRQFASTPAELDEALNQPEEAVFTPTPEQAQNLSGRHAGEALLQALLRELPQRSLAAVQRVAQSQLSSATILAQNPAELESTLALLAACPYDLAKCLRFPELCSACLLPLLSTDTAPIGGDARWPVILQRRCLMLFAAWADVPDALTRDLFGVACSLAAEFMTRGRHPLLRLQAARLAHSLLTCLNLDARAFEPHAPACFRGLAELLAEARTDQGQVQLLGVIASFLRYSVADLRPCLPSLVPHLPAMWSSAAGDQSRLAVLSVLCELAKLGDLSLGHFALPLAHACLTGPDLFWEGGLHLLLYLLCHLYSHPSTPEAAACLDDCVARLHARIADRACMEAMERRLLQVCAYLDCERYLRQHGTSLLAACQACLFTAAECWAERRLQALVLVNDLLKVSPQAAIHIVVSPLLPQLLARFATPPVATASANSALILQQQHAASDCLAANRLAFWRLASRVAIAQPGLLLASLQPANASTAALLLSTLLAGWIAACKRAAKLRDLKLLGLGLLLFGFAAFSATSGSARPLLDESTVFPDVVEAVLGAMMQCRREDGSSNGDNSIPLATTTGGPTPQEAAEDDQSCHEVRKKLANAADCVQRLSLVEHLRQELVGLGASLGDERTRRLLESLDSVTRTQLVELAAGGSNVSGFQLH